MKCFWYIVFVLFLNVVNSTFWNKNDFERVMGTYENDLSQDYLRALSIFKRKLQLLGFYPIISNDDGLEYVSLDPYMIDDDYDDEMYKLLKKMKKEKKARKKLLKKKSKKSKKSKKVNPTPTPTTTVQPISNIVYYWPATITTIVHPVEGTNAYEHSFETTFSSNTNVEKSSEENSAEVDETSTKINNQGNQSKELMPTKINYQTNISMERKLTFAEDDENNTKTLAVQNQTSIGSTSAIPTTTPYPLITVFTDPDEVAIQEILDQQEIVNKISNQENITETVVGEVKDLVDFTNESNVDVEEKLPEVDDMLDVTILPNGHTEGTTLDENEASLSVAKEISNEEKVTEEILPSQSTDTDTIPTTSIDEAESSSDSIEATTLIAIPAGVLEFFHETLPEHDEHPLSIGSPSTSEVVDNVSVSEPQVDAHISHELSETTEGSKTIDGHSEIYSEHNDSIVQVNEGNTTSSEITQPLDENLTTANSLDLPNSDDKIHIVLEIPIQTTHLPNLTEGFEYSFDPKISLPPKIDDDYDLESRSLTDSPLIAVLVDDKSGRRSDVPIEADDFNDEDTTDDLPYNLTGENLLEENKGIENTSAETSTPSSTTDILNFDNVDQFDGEIIPLIPIIIKQMKQGNVNAEEMEILKNTFGQFWSFIVEEASRESESSEEMNPMLSEVLNSVNRRVVKREATVGTWRRPIYDRRIYFDDDDDYVPRRRYYGLRRRRPIIDYYYK